MWVTFLFFVTSKCNLISGDLRGPFVPAVGGTFQTDPEVAANFSGGGFSISNPLFAPSSPKWTRLCESIGSKHPQPYKRVICFDNRRPQRAHGHVAIRAGGTQTCPPKRWASKSYSAVLISLLMVQDAQLRYAFTTASTSTPRPSSLSDRPPQESSPS